MTERTIEKCMEGFTKKTLQEAFNLYLELKNNGYTMDEAFAVWEEIRRKIKSTKMILAEPLKCPQCGYGMTLYKGDDNDSHWVCKRCRFSQYSEKSFAENVKAMEA